MTTVQSLGPAASIQVFQQRDGDPARRVQRLPRLAGGEGLRQRGEDPHRLGRTGG